MTEIVNESIEKSVERTFPAKVSENETIMEWIESTLEAWEVSMKLIVAFKICAEEIFVNIASYAYEGKDGEATIVLKLSNGAIHASFIDGGVEFNPLEQDAPDVSASAEERRIGGLGILMVKQMMDDVTYSRVSNKNHLTIKKSF